MKGLFIKDLRLMKNQRNFLVTIVLMFLILVITRSRCQFFYGICAIFTFNCFHDYHYL